MQVFDRRWVERVELAGLILELYMRYMDDGRKILHPVLKGWRWINNSLVFCMRWKLEDEGRTAPEITQNIIADSLRGIAEYLEFTVESGAYYEDGWLPSLDTSLKMNQDNIMEYRYYEKPTTTNHSCT